MNDIIKATSTAVALADDADPFQAFADAVAPQYIVGKLLKFSKGIWLAGENSEPVEHEAVHRRHACADDRLGSLARVQAGRACHDQRRQIACCRRAGTSSATTIRRPGKLMIAASQRIPGSSRAICR